MELKEDKNTKEKVIGRAYALAIENFSNGELEKIMTTHISDGAEIISDKWSGYNPSKTKFNPTFPTLFSKMIFFMFLSCKKIKKQTVFSKIEFLNRRIKKGNQNKINAKVFLVGKSKKFVRVGKASFMLFFKLATIKK